MLFKIVQLVVCKTITRLHQASFWPVEPFMHLVSHMNTFFAFLFFCPFLTFFFNFYLIVLFFFSCFFFAFSGWNTYVV